MVASKASPATDKPVQRTAAKTPAKAAAGRKLSQANTKKPAAAPAPAKAMKN